MYLFFSSFVVILHENTNCMQTCKSHGPIFTGEINGMKNKILLFVLFLWWKLCGCCSCTVWYTLCISFVFSLFIFVLDCFVRFLVYFIRFDLLVNFYCYVANLLVIFDFVFVCLCMLSPIVQIINVLGKCNVLQFSLHVHREIDSKRASERQIPKWNQRKTKKKKTRIALSCWDYFGFGLAKIVTHINVDLWVVNMYCTYTLLKSSQVHKIPCRWFSADSWQQ